jgi:predicted PhzF superfamily epimerase YddE/YHI9
MATTNREMTPGALEVELFIDGGRRGGGSWPPITDPYSELAIGVAGPHPPGEGAAYDVRNFYPKDGAVLEDPVCGSFNASLGEWLLQSGHRPVRRPSQNSDRPCRRRARHANEDGVLWVGGTTSTDIAGTVEL